MRNSAKIDQKEPIGNVDKTINEGIPIWRLEVGSRK
jgi:hypothetical protein